MLLKTKDGICCDWCGAILKNKFVYYSVSCIRVKVDKDKAETSPVSVDGDVVDFDVCEKCHKANVDKTLELYDKINNV